MDDQYWARFVAVCFGLPGTLFKAFGLGFTLQNEF